MPIYEYRCLNCDQEFELLRSMSQANEATLCLRCQGRAVRRLSLFASVVKGEDAWMDSVLENRGQGSMGGGCACGGACTCGAPLN